MPTKISHLFVAALAGSGAFVGASRLSAPDQDIEVIEAARPAPDAGQASAANPPSDTKPAPDPTPTADAQHSSDSGATANAGSASPTPAGGSEPVPGTTAAAPSTAAPPAGRFRLTADGAGDAFRTAAWTPPPPPPPPPVAPPPPSPPTAPPLPFSFVGLLEQKSGKPTAFLAKGEALVVAGVGDVIDGTYRVESLSPTGVVVTYLPLSQRQTVGPSGGTP
jgi:hypothetical protein